MPNVHMEWKKSAKSLYSTYIDHNQRYWQPLFCMFMKAPYEKDTVLQGYPSKILEHYSYSKRESFIDFLENYYKNYTYWKSFRKHKKKGGGRQFQWF